MSETKRPGGGRRAGGLVVVAMALLAVPACDGCGCDEGRDERREAVPALGAAEGSATRARGSEAEGVGSGAGTAESPGSNEAVAAARRESHLRLPTTGSPLPLPSTNAVELRITLAALTVDDVAALPLEHGRDASGDRVVFRERIASAVRQAADARWFAALERGADPSNLGDEHGIAVFVAAEAEAPVATLNDVLGALEDVDQPAFVVGVGRDGERRWVRHARPGEPRLWSPSAPREVVAAPSAEGDDEPDDTRVQRRVYAGAGPNADNPDTAPRLGPSWDDRTVPVQVTVLPAGVWLMAGTMERPMTGLIPTGMGRDRDHPNFAAAAPLTAGTEPDAWLDWAALQRELLRVREPALTYELVPSVAVGASEELPVGLLVRALDVVWLDVGHGPRLAEGTAFTTALLDGTALPGFLPPPGLREIGRGANGRERQAVEAVEE